MFSSSATSVRIFSKVGAADIDHDHIVFVKALVNRYHIIGEEGGFPDGPALDQYIFIFRHIDFISLSQSKHNILKFFFSGEPK